MKSTLSIRDLSCCYDQQTILRSLSLEVEKGEIVCLLGASGCGKTTLLKSIAGLVPLTHGSMSLNDRLLDDGQAWLPPEQRHIGMIFQDYALFPHLTVAQNIAFGLAGLTAREKSAIVGEMLSLVHLEGYGERYPHQLSGGQQQRIAIARSLAHKPDLLLLDEPFSNIDTQIRHELILQIRSLFKSQGVTAIFVTHSREEAFAFADKMAVMNHGVIEQFGSASELYHQPSSQFVADFLGGGSYLAAQRIGELTFTTRLGVVTAQSRHKIRLGEECQLLLRPRHVVIRQDKNGDARVVGEQFLGDSCRYMVEVGEARLMATSCSQISVGDRVAVSLLGDGIRAFP